GDRDSQVNESSAVAPSSGHRPRSERAGEANMDVMESENEQAAFQCYLGNLDPVWCPGCGDFSVLGAFIEAAGRLGLPNHQLALVSGIGCSSRFPFFVNVYGFHGVHGRALPIAQGLKLANPELTVVVPGGDGDGLAI